MKTAEPTVEAGFPVLFVRTRGGRIVHAWDCPAQGKRAVPWKWAARNKLGYDTVMEHEVVIWLVRDDRTMRFCRTCLPWQADVLAPAPDETRATDA